MKTGLIETWAVNPADVGPMYPFVDHEVILFLVCFVFWAAYTIWQLRFEWQHFAREDRELSTSDNCVRAIQKNSGT